MSPSAGARSADRKFFIGLARAFGGGIIFGLPLLMTMEMWMLGATMPPTRLALLVVVWFPLLVGLSAVAGFEGTLRLKHDLLDAFVAIAVGAVAAGIVLVMLGVIGPEVATVSIVGMVTLQALPGSMGALLAVSQFGGDDDDGDEAQRRDSWGGEVLLMAIGALFLAFNIAPTEEITLLAAKMTPWQSAALLILSLVLMHAFVYAVEFSGQASIDPSNGFHSVFIRYTIVGYAVVLVLSAYSLWTFGRLDGLEPAEMMALTVALAFPGAIGAAAARLLI